VQERLSAALVKGSTFFATEALDIGLITVNFLVRDIFSASRQSEQGDSS
jgi:hypothetical protein